MQHPFDALAPEYSRLLAGMEVTRASEARAAAIRLVRNKAKFVDVQATTGVPIAWAMASFEREASSDFRKSPAQGDPWNRKSIHVPKGRGPFSSWTAAAIDAYQIDHLDEVGAGNWLWARACFEGELFNGFGYRDHGLHTPYLWAGTNVYSRGKYIADGHLDLSVVDKQLGIIPMIVELIALDPTLALPEAMPIVAGAPRIAPAEESPAGVGGGAHDTRWLQHQLNVLDHAGIQEDGSYGRKTRAAVRDFQIKAMIHVDGFAGDETFGAIDKRLLAASA